MSNTFFLKITLIFKNTNFCFVPLVPTPKHYDNMMTLYFYYLRKQLLNYFLTVFLFELSLR